jgi:hypothetical protein
MQELFYEESITTTNLSQVKVKYYIVKVIAIISLIIGVLVTFFFFMFVDLSNIFQVVFFAIILVGSYLLGFIYLRKKDSFLLDFDYTFVSGSVRISKVLNNKRRKQVISFNTSDILKIGKFESKTYEGIAKDTLNKKIIVTPNQTAAEGRDFYYIHFSSKGIKYLIVLECSELFMYNVLKFSSKTVLESDFK